MSAHHGEVDLVARWLAPRWKAVAALVIALVGGLVSAFPDSSGIRVVSGVVTAVATAVGVHQVPNQPLPVAAGEVPPAG